MPTLPPPTEAQRKYDEYLVLAHRYKLRVRSWTDWSSDYREQQAKVAEQASLVAPAKKAQPFRVPPALPPPARIPPGATVRCEACDHEQPDRGQRATCRRCGLQPIPSHAYPKTCVFYPHPDPKPGSTIEELVEQRRAQLAKEQI